MTSTRRTCCTSLRLQQPVRHGCLPGEAVPLRALRVRPHRPRRRRRSISGCGTTGWTRRCCTRAPRADVQRSDPDRQPDHGVHRRRHAMASQCGALYTRSWPAAATPADTGVVHLQLLQRPVARRILPPRIGVSFPVTDRPGSGCRTRTRSQSPSFNLLASGAQHRPVDHEHERLVRPRPELRQDDHVRVRHPARLQPDMVLDIVGVQQGRGVERSPVRIMPIFDPVNAASPATSTCTPTRTSGTCAASTSSSTAAIGQIFQGTLVYTYQSNARPPARTRTSTSTRLPGDQQRARATGRPPPQALLTSRRQPDPHDRGQPGVQLPARVAERHDARHDPPGRRPQRDVPVRERPGRTPDPRQRRRRRDGPGQRLRGSPTSRHGDAELRPRCRGSRTWTCGSPGLPVGGRSLTVFADFRNLFNWTNLTASSPRPATW